MVLAPAQLAGRHPPGLVPPHAWYEEPSAQLCAGPHSWHCRSEWEEGACTCHWVAEQGGDRARHSPVIVSYCELLHAAEAALTRPSARQAERNKVMTLSRQREPVLAV